MNINEYVCVFFAEHLLQAQIVRAYLSNQGIDVSIRDELLAGGVGELPPSSGVEVCVPAAQYEQAKTLMDAWRAGQYRLDDDFEDMQRASDQEKPLSLEKKKHWPFYLFATVLVVLVVLLIV